MRILRQFGATPAATIEGLPAAAERAGAASFRQRKAEAAAASAARQANAP